MHFLPQEIDDYVVAHSQKEPELLQQLNTETWQTVLNPRMLSGSFQGRVLAMIAKLTQPTNILENLTEIKSFKLSLDFMAIMKQNTELIRIEI